MNLNSHWHVGKTMHTIISVYLRDMTKTKEAPILCMHTEYIASLSVWLTSHNPVVGLIPRLSHRARCQRSRKISPGQRAWKHSCKYMGAGFLGNSAVPIRKKSVNAWSGTIPTSPTHFLSPTVEIICTIIWNLVLQEDHSIGVYIALHVELFFINHLRSHPSQCDGPYHTQCPGPSSYSVPGLASCWPCRGSHSVIHSQPIRVHW